MKIIKRRAGQRSTSKTLADGAIKSLGYSNLDGVKMGSVTIDLLDGKGGTTLQVLLSKEDLERMLKALS